FSRDWSSDVCSSDLGGWTHALDLRVLLQEQEDFKQRRRRLAEHVRVRDLYEAMAQLEARVERLGRFAALQQDLFLQQFEQHFVETVELCHRAVVALHELLDRAVAALVLVTELPRQLQLRVEQQPFLAPPIKKMQGEAHPREEAATVVQALEFIRGE